MYPHLAMIGFALANHDAVFGLEPHELRGVEIGFRIWLDEVAAMH